MMSKKYMQRSVQLNKREGMFELEMGTNCSFELSWKNECMRREGGSISCSSNFPINVRTCYLHENGPVSNNKKRYKT